MSRRLLTRAATLAASTVVAAGVLVGVSTPASAAPLGTVNLSATSGTVTANPMFASATTSAPCPATFGEEAALRIGPAETGPFTNLAPSVGGGGFDTAPVTISPNRSFQTALGSAPADGRWWIVVECFSLTAGRNPNRFITEILVSGANWRVNTGAEATTTTLAVSPASPAPAGTPVTLTATVAPAAAAGSVEFFRGSVSLGTAAASGGTATLSNVTIPSGTWSLTARFTPANAGEYGASTSTAVSYTVEGGGGGQSVQQTITATVDPGAFTITLNGDGEVALQGGTVGGTATGSLDEVTITDLRGTNAGWNVTGQFPGFSQEGGAATIPNSNLTWDPSATKTSGSGTVAEGATADLGDTRTLCSAASGSSAGVFVCDAGLSLAVPDNVPPGTYSGTLTLTLI